MKRMKPAGRLPLALALALLAGTAHANCSVVAGYPETTPDSDFTDNGNGTVRHNPTGLIWKRCAEGETWTGATCTGSPLTYTWEGAFQRAAAVNAGTEGENAGYTDWRLPSINELKSLVELGCPSPAINTTQFPTATSLIFWTSSPRAGSTTNAWIVDFPLGGDDDYQGRSAADHVRLVRGGQSFYTFDAALDYTPDALGDYPPASNAAGAVTPAPSGKTLSGLTTVTGIRIEGAGSPQYRVNGGAWTSVPGVVENGDQVEVRLTAGAAGSVRTATLTVGGMTADFQVTANGASGTQPVPVLGPLGLLLLSGLLGLFGFAARRR